MDGKTIALLLIAFVACGTAVAQAQDTTPSVSVSGTATTRVAPDLIVWNLTTTDENVNLQTAKASSDEKLQSILSTARDLGVDEEDIQTGYVDIERRYDHLPTGERGEFRGYTIRRGVTLKQHDLDRFDEFLDQLVAGAEFEADFQLTSSKAEEIRWETRVEAVKLAKKKAESMAEAVDASVGKVLSLREEGPIRPMPYTSNAFFGGGLGGSGNGGDPGQDTFVPGKIEFSVTVHAEFALN